MSGSQNFGLELDAEAYADPTSLLDDTISLCRSVLETSFTTAWRAENLRKSLIDMERRALQKQLEQLEHRPEDMQLACEYHRRRFRYDQTCAEVAKSHVMLEAERQRWRRPPCPMDPVMLPAPVHRLREHHSAASASAWPGCGAGTTAATTAATVTEASWVPHSARPPSPRATHSSSTPSGAFAASPLRPLPPRPGFSARKWPPSPTPSESLSVTAAGSADPPAWGPPPQDTQPAAPADGSYRGLFADALELQAQPPERAVGASGGRAAAAEHTLQALARSSGSAGPGRGSAGAAPSTAAGGGGPGAGDSEAVGGVSAWSLGAAASPFDSVGSVPSTLAGAGGPRAGCSEVVGRVSTRSDGSAASGQGSVGSMPSTPAGPGGPGFDTEVVGVPLARSNRSSSSSSRSSSGLSSPAPAVARGSRTFATEVLGSVPPRTTGPATFGPAADDGPPSSHYAAFGCVSALSDDSAASPSGSPCSPVPPLPVIGLANFGNQRSTQDVVCMSARSNASSATERGVLGCVHRHVEGSAALRSMVGGIFKECARGRQSLDLAGARELAATLSKRMRISEEEAFRDMEDEFVRFDFNGDSSLQEHETYRLVRYHLKDYRRRLGHVLYEVDVPRATLEEREYTIVEDLGQGSQGECKLAWLPDASQHCIKILQKSNLMVRLDELKEEIDILRHVHNDHIIKILNIFQDEHHFYVVSEAYFGSDFARLRKNAAEQNVELTEDWWRSIFQQCFKGLYYMHQHALMHCDIKEPNVMFKQEDLRRPEVVFIDFGLAQEFTHAQVVLCGTPGYIPPETWQRHKWFPKGDVFSMGVCLLQLLADSPGIFTHGARPLPHAYEDVERFTVTRSAPLQLLPEHMEGAKGFLSEMLEKDMDRRINAFQAVHHSWLRLEPGSPKTSSPSSSLPFTAPNTVERSFSPLFEPTPEHDVATTRAEQGDAFEDDAFNIAVQVQDRAPRRDVAPTRVEQGDAFDDDDFDIDAQVQSRGQHRGVALTRAEQGAVFDDDALDIDVQVQDHAPHRDVALTRAEQGDVFDDEALDIDVQVQSRAPHRDVALTRAEQGDVFDDDAFNIDVQVQEPAPHRDIALTRAEQGHVFEDDELMIDVQIQDGTPKDDVALTRGQPGGVLHEDDDMVDVHFQDDGDDAVLEDASQRRSGPERYYAAQSLPEGPVSAGFGVDGASASSQADDSPLASRSQPLMFTDLGNADSPMFGSPAAPAQPDAASRQPAPDSDTDESPQASPSPPQFPDLGRADPPMFGSPAASARPAAASRQDASDSDTDESPPASRPPPQGKADPPVLSSPPAPARPAAYSQLEASDSESDDDSPPAARPPPQTFTDLGKADPPVLPSSTAPAPPVAASQQEASDSDSDESTGSSASPVPLQQATDVV